MEHFHAIIFDLDGVIIDSEPRHEQAFRKIFEELGYAEDHGIDFPAYYGRSDRTIWIDFIEKHQPPQSLEELMARKQEVFLELIHREKPIFPTIPQLVSQLSTRYKLAVASGSEHRVITAVLDLGDLLSYFPVTVSAQDVSRGKPAPDIFLHTADKLAVSPKKCCVIEDSAAGVEAALAAGMNVIAITNSIAKEKLTQASHIVSSYPEIREILLPPQGP